mgnify:CR=1 FL=1|jgi:hypothetical protein
MLQDQSHNLSLLRLGSMGHNAVDETHGEMIENAAIPPNQAKLLTLLGTCQNQTSANYLNKPQIQRNSEADCTYSIPPFFLPSPTKAQSGPIPPSGKGKPRIFIDRQKGFYEAVRFAETIGLPMRLTFTVTWGCLIDLGDRNEGNILGKSDEERCADLRKRMGRLAKRLGFDLALVWGRAVGPDVGAHIHGLLYWPPMHIDALSDLFASMSGSDVSLAPYQQAGDVRSDCGGWLLRWSRRSLEGAIEYADYIAKHDQKFTKLQTLAGRCFGNSNAIGHSERRKAGR